MNLAPLALFVYNRPQHTNQTIEALKQNFLTKETDLIIFSDAPKITGNIEKDKQTISLVSEVREILNSINGFKSVTIKKQNENKGLAKSIISGVTEILSWSDRVIVMEDDLVSSPYFLQYMNNALEHYQSQSKVFNISAFSLPPSILQIPKDYPYGAYFLYRNSSWGWGTWKDRWQKAIWDHEKLSELIHDEINQAEFDKGGEDLTPMLLAQLDGKIDSWSIRWSFTLSYFKGISLTPVHSYISNIGFDGTGVHCGTIEDNSVYQHHTNLTGADIVFPKTFEVSKEISRNFARYYGEIPLLLLEFPEIKRKWDELHLKNKELTNELQSIYNSRGWKIMSAIKRVVKFKNRYYLFR